MAPAGTILSLKKTKTCWKTTVHLWIWSRFMSPRASTWLRDGGESVADMWGNTAERREGGRPWGRNFTVNLRPTWQRSNKMCLWDDFFVIGSIGFFLFVCFFLKVEEGIKKSVRLQWRVAGIRKTLPQIQKKNIKSNTIGSALLQVRGELGKVKNQVCLSTSTNQYHICGISLPIQSNKTKSSSSWAGAVAPGVWKLKEGARPLHRHPKRIPK